MRVAPAIVTGLLVLAARAGTLDDMELRSNVETAIRGSAATATLHLKIEVESGVAVPSGLVKNLTQADDVVELAAKVRGIIDVDRSGLRFEYAGAADEVIASRAGRALLEIPHLASSSIRVDVRQGVVTLDGELKRASYRREVRLLCGAIEGVVEVDDRLVSPEAPDAAIQKSLDGVFGARVIPRFPGVVEVQVDHGAVVLSGRVPRLSDKRAALRAAWAVDGVRRVVDDLRVGSLSSAVKVVKP